MKFLAVFMLLTVSSQLSQAREVNYFKDDFVSKLATRGIAEKIKEFLENLKETMKTGDESKGIPKMDPFDLNHQEIDLEHQLVTAEGEVNDLHVEGLSVFDVKQADFKLAKKNFSIKLMWPRIKGNTLYNVIDARIGDLIPFFGKGSSKFEVTNLTFGTNAKLKLDLKNKKIEIIEFSNTEIFIDGLRVDSTGIYNNDELSEFASGVINDLAPQGLIDFQSTITAEVNKIMLEVGNKILPSVVETIWDLLMP